MYYYNRRRKGLYLAAETGHVGVSYNQWHDMATDDFSVGVLFFTWDTISNVGTWKTLISKYDSSGGVTLHGKTGWGVFYDADNERLVVAINDGSSVQGVCYTAAGSFPMAGLTDAANEVADESPTYWATAFVVVERGVGCTVYKNGVALANAADTTGNIVGDIDDASSTVKIGGDPNAANTYMKGMISSLYLFRSFAPGADWVYDWHWRQWFLMPRSVWAVDQWTTIWNWEDGYYGEILTKHPSYAYNVWQENYEQVTGTPYGSVSRTNYFPFRVGIFMPDNFQPGIERGYLPLDAKIRAQDGTMKLYRGGSKQRLFASFVSDSLLQRYFLEGAFLSRSILTISENPDKVAGFHGFFTAPPQFREIYPGVYRYALELEEI
jgi:hypothetical protein